MKRIISLLLVLVLCVTLPLSVCAAELSPGGSSGNTGDTSGNTGDTSGKTGDTAQLGLWITVMVVSFLLLIVVAVAFRKTFKKNGV